VLDAKAASSDDALSMETPGNYDTLAFKMPSVAHMLPLINGRINVASFTYDPLNGPGCTNTYPNCGSLVIPGSSASYLQAVYFAHTMATKPIYVTATGQKTYDGLTSIDPVNTSATLNITYANDTPVPSFASTFGSALTFSTPSKMLVTIRL